jgi:hypothetical protein
MHITIRKIKTGLLIAILGLPSFGALSITTASIISSPVFADSASKQAACAGLNELDNTTNADCSNLDTQSGGFTNTISAIVDILSWVVGIVSIIMVLVAGLKYMTSGGDANKAGSAKSTLIYAMIGLAIAALAQALVHFVLSSTVNATTQ